MSERHTPHSIARRWSLLFLVLGCTALSPAAEHPRIRVGVESNSPPLSFIDPAEKPTGFTAELLAAMNGTGKVEVEIVASSWKYITEEFNAGRLDALANVIYTEERHVHMDFSIDHAFIHGVAYTRPDTPAIRRTADLAGKRIATLKGSLAHTHATAHPEWRTTIVLYPSWQTMLAAVVSKECDAALFLRPLVEEQPDSYGLHSEFVDDLIYQFRFAVHKGDAGTLERLNAALARVLHDGTFDQLYRKWLGPIEPHPVQAADLRPYAVPAVLVILLVLAIFGWQRHMLHRIARQAEALRESEARWKFALEGSGDGVWDWNLAAGTVLRSPRLKAMLGYAENEIGSAPEELHRLIHPEDLPGQRAALQAHLDGTRPVYAHEHRVQARDGRWLWQLDHGLVVSRDAAGRPLRMIGTHTDITERHASAAAREQMITSLQAALANVKTLSSLLPICSGCKKIRDDQGYWSQVETYIHQHTGTQFSHGMCPDCLRRYYPSYSEPPPDKS
ncbi:MAG: transporter substrate-binding domain-containing protein [Lacunisphaera sp.]|nr:transporter substrate-binding domain-containing protein [Lacunisphaera sp.]